MNYEGKIIQLRKINSGLQKIALRLYGGNIPEPHSQESKRMMARLARWQKIVIGMSKNAQSQISLAEVKQQNLKNRRGAQKFSEQQSQRDQIKNAQSILDACALSTETIGNILRRLGRNAQMEMAKDLAERGAKIIKKAMDGNAHELTHVVQQGAGVSPLSPPPKAISGGTGVLLVLASAITLLSMVLSGKGRK